MYLANTLPPLYLWHLAERPATVWICLHRFLFWWTARKHQQNIVVLVLKLNTTVVEIIFLRYKT